MSVVEELKPWIEKIEKIAARLGLSFYPQEFYVVSKEKIIEAMAYHGGYPMYSHWSFGKSLKIGKILYEKNYFFLPYEIVINTDPCRAFLLESNPLFYNILVAAHVYGHNDFFKNNRNFKETRPERILPELEKYRLKIKKFIGDPKIGIQKVEKVMDACHAAMFIPTNLDFFRFLAENGGHLSDWEKEIISAAGTVNNHLWPNVLTKIINEGWATYWHFRIIEELKNELSFDDYYRMQMAHLRVIRMPANQKIINPYRVGFFLWKKLADELGEAAIFEIRKEMADFEFLLSYFSDKDDFIYLNFIKPLLEMITDEALDLSPEDRLALARQLMIFIDENGKITLAPEQRELLAAQYKEKVLAARGENLAPRFDVSIETQNEPWLCLKHKYDGRSLDLGEDLKVLQMIQALWRYSVVLETTKDEKKGLYTEQKTFKYICRDGKIIPKKIK